MGCLISQITISTSGIEDYTDCELKRHQKEWINLSNYYNDLIQSYKTSCWRYFSPSAFIQSFYQEANINIQLIETELERRKIAIV